nr:Chain A, AA139 [Arenicola marina]
GFCWYVCARRNGARVCYRRCN